MTAQRPGLLIYNIPLRARCKLKGKDVADVCVAGLMIPRLWPRWQEDDTIEHRCPCSGVCESEEGARKSASGKKEKGEVW
mmetsp:Transcript_47568/g.101771  ORF Transcript_47568/g.101771 Transcript_47568/m.101771 type:complete len:80 (+) Transcript_47568:88-327(+)